MPLAITAAGMVSAVGFNAGASLAALRAGVRNIRQTNLWDAESGTYLGAGKVDLPHWHTGIGKLADLAAPAILECLSAASWAEPHRIPVVLGLAPESRPFRPSGLDAAIVDELQDRLGFAFHPASRTIAADHVSAALGLRYADEILARGEAPCVVVAAVDSLLHHGLEEHYLRQRRLLTPDNSNGFSLGEAGSAVLVVSSGQAKANDLHVRGIGLARERATIESDEPLRAYGLTDAVRDAFAAADTTIQDVQYRIADLNGEHYKFKEMALAMGRFPRRPTAHLFDVWHPIEYIGDVGAAIGPIALAWAWHAGRHGYGNGPSVLCTFANDDGARAAMLVSSAQVVRQ